MAIHGINGVSGASGVTLAAANEGRNAGGCCLLHTSKWPHAYQSVAYILLAGCGAGQQA